jgi:hypothetical protein
MISFDVARPLADSAARPDDRPPRRAPGSWPRRRWRRPRAEQQRSRDGARRRPYLATPASRRRQCAAARPPRNPELGTASTAAPVIDLGRYLTVAPTPSEPSVGAHRPRSSFLPGGSEEGSAPPPITGCCRQRGHRHDAAHHTVVPADARRPHGVNTYVLVPNGEYLLAIHGETQLAAHQALGRSGAIDPGTRKKHRQFPLAVVFHHDIRPEPRGSTSTT